MHIDLAVIASQWSELAVHDTKGISSSSRRHRGSPSILSCPLWSLLAGVVAQVEVFELGFEVFDIS